MITSFFCSKSYIVHVLEYTEFFMKNKLSLMFLFLHFDFQLAYKSCDVRVMRDMMLLYILVTLTPSINGMIIHYLS